MVRTGVHRATLAVATFVSILYATHPAQARDRIRVALTAVQDADAKGQVRLLVRRPSDGRLELHVRRLDPHSVFEILFDGVKVGTLETRSGGSGRVRFRSRPRGHDLTLGFDPRGGVLVVRNRNGEDVLRGEIPLSGVPAGNDPEKVACCVPDDRGSKCEDRSPERCVLEGGTVSAAASCLPDPCGGVATSGRDVVCCLPDDSGPECEDRTQDQCALQGGIVVDAASCAPNPCAATPPPADTDIRCCLPDDSGSACEDRTAVECAAQGGIDLGPGLCAPDTCAGILFPPTATASVRVTCERRSNRSRVSINGTGLASGSYTARALSGSHQGSARAQSTTGDEIEFDFDSDPGDVAAGATLIGADFLQGNPPVARGQILDTLGNVVAEGVATCRVR
jgi:hypothetical protein